MSGILYVIATPIGNMEDLTDRAKRTLSEVTLVAAEDTSNTSKIFKHLGIGNKMSSNHKFNELKRTDSFIKILENGQDIALVSDAGTPCISDPGAILVKACIDRAIKVESIPGPSSVIAALSISGISFDKFIFYGFLPKEAKAIKEIIIEASNQNKTACVFFESPKRIIKTISLLNDEIPEAQVCLCNDLTKMYERIYRGKPRDILAELLDNPSAGKGEYTIVIECGFDGKLADTDEVPLSLEAVIIDHIIKNGVSIK